MTLLDKPYLKIELDDSIPGLIITWRGFTTSEEFRQGADIIATLMAEHKITKTITDLTDHRVISTEDQEYAAKVSINFSRNYWSVKRALITPKDVFTRFGAKQVNAHVAKEEQQERRFFASLEEALEWIKNDNQDENA
jgi:hemerythrin-like domain-containing protein